MNTIHGPSTSTDGIGDGPIEGTPWIAMADGVDRGVGAALSPAQPPSNAATTTANSWGGQATRRWKLRRADVARMFMDGTPQRWNRRGARCRRAGGSAFRLAPVVRPHRS